MRPLSPTEAISPALDRTRDLLMRPFLPARFLKLTALAFLAEIGGSFSVGLPGRMGRLPLHNPALAAALAAFLAIFALIAFTIGLMLFYAGSRLQLALVEIVATCQTFVGPLWRKYGGLTWRWIGLKLLFLVACGILAAPFLLLFAAAQHRSAVAHVGRSHLTPQNAALLAVGLIGGLVIVAGYLLLRDLALPILAIEHLGVLAALSRLVSILTASPGQIAVYLLLRLVLSFAFGIAAEFVAFLIVLVSALPFAILGGSMWFALHTSGPSALALLSAAGILGAAVLLLWGAILFLVLLGAVSLFGQAYALYFFGGRYAPLGGILDASLPVPPMSVRLPIEAAPVPPSQGFWPA